MLKLKEALKGVINIMVTQFIMFIIVHVCNGEML